MASNSSSASSTALFEVSLLGLIPPSIFSFLVARLNSLAFSSSPFVLTETAMLPIFPPEGAKPEEGGVRVREGGDGRSYLVVLSRPESLRTSPLALITPVLYSLLLPGANPVDIASHLGFKKNHAFTKRGVEFVLGTGQVKVEVVRVEREGERATSVGEGEQPYVVEVRSGPIPHAGVGGMVEVLLGLKKQLVGLVDLGRVDP